MNANAQTSASTADLSDYVENFRYVHKDILESLSAKLHVLETNTEALDAHFKEVFGPVAHNPRLELSPLKYLNHADIMERIRRNTSSVRNWVNSDIQKLEMRTRTIDYRHFIIAADVTSTLR